ncbi:MAG: alternative ribosome rescue aminoacyl-tRNA hydrolase ArfB [Bacteroidota bacterium]|nr:alternative ribosome rescue aminoacyl-tRNA hydrolase ArfB [Bacteroidota bacterium]
MACLGNRDFSPEFTFNASRSSGAGGQNVNKVSTKVELRFNIDDSQILSQEEKEILKKKLATKISQEGFLIIVSQTGRTQFQNKEKVIEKFYALVEKALKPVRKRKPTRPTKASKEKRLEEKRIHSERKSIRGNHFESNI